jgi:uncharacterized protein
MLRILLSLLLSLIVLPAFADCNGFDIRAQLTASQRTTLQREVDKVPFNQGNHWIATRGDQTIHVVGAISFNDPRFKKVMRTLRPVIAKSDAILIEASSRNDLNQDFVQENSALFMLPKGVTLQEMLSVEGWQALTAKVKNRGWNLDVVAKHKPWVISSQLTGTSCGPRGSSGKNGLIFHIEKQAQRKRVPVGLLETVEAVLRTTNSQPMKDQASLLDFDLLNPDGLDQAFVTIRESYFDETLTEAMILLEWRLSRGRPGPESNLTRAWQRQQNAALGKRNKSWMPVISGTKGDMLMVVVGAANLPGHDGLLNLLHKAGYKMQRAAF